jgi:pimeloyl-ACP methyl ester carboxylesterase
VSSSGPAHLAFTRRGEGSPLLLLHSLGGTRVQWNPVLDPLAAHRDVIAVDMPGFGDSPPLPDGVPPTAANLATAVLEFYESLGVDATPAVAGISYGAWTAIECARQGRARAVVALCPAGFWREPLGPPDPRLARARRIGRRLGPLLRLPALTARGRGATLGRSFRHPERLSPSEAYAITRAYIRSPAYPEASAQMRAATVEDLSGIRVPITLAWAEHDRLLRNKPLKEGILPKAVRQVVLPGCGHVPTWDDPELVARVILEGTAASGRIGA